MAPQRYGSRECPQFQLRMPDGLREQIKHAADANGRSMNSELVLRLEQSFSAERSAYPEIARLLDAHIEQEVSARLKQIALRISGAA